RSPSGNGVLEAAGREGGFPIGPPRWRLPAWANDKGRPAGSRSMNGKFECLRAVSKMENFAVGQKTPARFPIFERTSSPPSKDPKAPGASGGGDSFEPFWLGLVGFPYLTA